ncbi:sugar phosphate nucleotidyltransferase [Thermicanus aegyptius]|uniref:sugar phosphate nucleotidyltransferase n=1 Tax=Thermicanus aegyptius TaxID=94009 RepID=UPI0003FBDA6E|nr:sugar phosphate nucleotidyltransferase [Thermicanus aegyptius]
MKLVLLSGGSGKRLWPLSNDSRSKQFLRLLDRGDGVLESMVQRVWRQLKNVGLAEFAYVATGKVQREMIRSHLGEEVSIIVEPERRDTFPAIALASVYLYSIERMSSDETVAVLPVDPYVEESFFLQVKRLDPVLRRSGADLALIGIRPLFPSEKYGYIVPFGKSLEGRNPFTVESASDYFSVSHFREKPKAEEAQKLIDAGALWNAGVFAFTLGTMIRWLAERSYPLQYEELVKQYERLPNISFDYEVVEKTDRIVVLPYEGAWKDLGTWNTLTEEMGSPILGKGVISEDSKNSRIVNELDLPVAVLGVSDVVVAASPDGILVTSKEASPRVKELMKDHVQMPMYEERRWGWYRILDYTHFEDGQEVLTKRIAIHEGKYITYQIHFKRSETWTVIRGEGELAMEGEIRTVQAGEVIQIPPGTPHGIRALTEMELIEVQQGKELIEEDIMRIYSTWDEVVQALVKDESKQVE